MSDLQSEIEAFFSDYASRWNGQDYETLEDLWDTGDPLPFYRPMEVDRVITGWDNLRKYWNPGVKIIDGLWNEYVDIVPKLITDDVCVVATVLNWNIKARGAKKAQSGSDPCIAVLKRTPDGWRMVAYVEACMHPATYVRKLFERQARPSFLQFLEELGGDGPKEKTPGPGYWS